MMKAGMERGDGTDEGSAKAQGTQREREEGRRSRLCRIREWREGPGCPGTLPPRLGEESPVRANGAWRRNWSVACYLPSSFDLAVPFRYARLIVSKAKLELASTEALSGLVLRSTYHAKAVRDAIPGASGRGEERGDLGLETDSDRGYT